MKRLILLAACFTAFGVWKGGDGASWSVSNPSSFIADIKGSSLSRSSPKEAAENAKRAISDVQSRVEDLGNTVTSGINHAQDTYERAERAYDQGVDATAKAADKATEVVSTGLAVTKESLTQVGETTIRIGGVTKGAMEALGEKVLDVAPSLAKPEKPKGD